MFDAEIDPFVENIQTHFIFKKFIHVLHLIKMISSKGYKKLLDRFDNDVEVCQIRF